MERQEGEQRDLLVALDIGTTKVCAVVGEVAEDDTVKVNGIGEAASKGLRNGMVVNIEDTVRSIRQAVVAAGQMAGCSISSVYVGIAGSHIMSLNSHGVIGVQPSGVVTKEDVDRVLKAAQAIAIPSDREILHTIPQEYMVDKQHGILDPLDMAGVRLEVNVHIVTGAVSSAKNIVNACRRAGLGVEKLALEALLSAQAVLTNDERDLGVVLVDLGGGTADIAIFEKNAIRHTAVVPYGGSSITHDIAFGLRTSQASAEHLKIKFGCVLPSLIGENETIEVPSVGGRPPQKIPRRLLVDICQPRMEEIFEFINKSIISSGCKDRIRAGMVLTGGAALIAGCRELAERILNMQVRIGYPRKIGGLTDVVNNPRFSTGVGLLRFAAESEKEYEPIIDKKGVAPLPPDVVDSDGKRDKDEIVSTPLPPEKKDGLFKRIANIMRQWFGL